MKVWVTVVKVKDMVEVKDIIEVETDGENGSQRQRCHVMSLSVKGSVRKRKKDGAGLDIGVMARN